MNQIQEGGFETIDGWDLLGGAGQYNLLAYAGQYSAQLVSRGTDLVSPVSVSRWSRSDVEVVAGTAYDLEFWVYRLSASDSMRVRFLDLDGNVLYTREVEPDDAAIFDWTRITGSWTPVDSEFVEVRVENFTSSPTSSSFWWVDELSLSPAQVEDPMAIMLSERAIDAVVTCLTDNLGTECDAINADRADDYDIAPPLAANIYKLPKSELANGTVHVEVFEDTFEFDNPYSDIANNRAVTSIPTTIRVTFLNHGDNSGATMPAGAMITKMRRYGAAVFNAITKNYQLVSPVDDAIKLTRVVRVIPAWEVDDEDTNKVTKVTTTIQVVIEMEECE